MDKKIARVCISALKPKVYIGIPTGVNKEYANLYMLASLKNVDYPPERLELTFCVTHLGTTESDQYLQRLQNLIENSQFKCSTKILKTYPTLADMDRWGSYFAVILNLHHMRVDFLKSDCDMFWLLGGDNPPPRKTLKQLVNLRADVNSARVHQRPVRVGKGEGAYPVIWDNQWKIQDLENIDVDPIVKDQLRTAWLEIAFLKMPTLEECHKQQILNNVEFGSGCILIKRKVLETVGFALGKAGTHSEDIHFCQHTNLRGYTTRWSNNIRCLHFDPDGQVY